MTRKQQSRKDETDTVTKISKPILMLGCSLGFILTLAVMNGDANGRVNLLYLLLIFVVIPLLGTVVSIVGLISREGMNIAKLTSLLPVWTAAQRTSLLALKRRNLSKPWFFVQSQSAALGYSITSLIAFVLLLLATDVNFIWRSTLLSADDLLAMLQVVAAPWWFWEAAQPTMALLEQTKDSRLLGNMVNAEAVGQWWLFVLATQITYAFLLRGLLLSVGQLYLVSRLSKSQQTDTPQSAPTTVPESTSTPPLAKPTKALPANYQLFNFANIPAEVIARLPLGEPQNVDLERSYDNAVLVLVKAWEPPLGELQDFMQLNRGAIYPVYYRNAETLAVPPQYLDEWRRFVEQVPNWLLYLPAQQDIK